MQMLAVKTKALMNLVSIELMHVCDDRECINRSVILPPVDASTQ